MGGLHVRPHRDRTEARTLSSRVLQRAGAGTVGIDFECGYIVWLDPGLMPMPHSYNNVHAAAQVLILVLLVKWHLSTGTKSRTMLWARPPVKDPNPAGCRIEACTGRVGGRTQPLLQLGMSQLAECFVVAEVVMSSSR